MRKWPKICACPHTPRQMRSSESLRTAMEIKPPSPLKSLRSFKLSLLSVATSLYDLNELDKANAIKNLLVIKSIESKLPESLKKDWLTHAADPKNAVTHQNRFGKLLAYLQSQESIYEQLDQLRDVDPAKERTKFPIKYARTKSVKSSTDPAGCIICGDPKHKRKLYICRRFRTNTKLQEKKDAVQQLGACERCLEIHDGPCRKTTYLCGKPECKDQHHYLLCPLPRPLSQRPKSGPVRAEGRRYTEVQEEFISKLSPELAQQCRKAFCNVSSQAFNSMAAEKGLLEETGLKEYPVILMLLDVIANDGQRIGTLIDLASDTNYITHKAASKLNLRSEDVMLVIQGVGGMKVSVATKRYLLKIRVNTSRGTLKPHQLVCYGLDKIAEVKRHVPPQKLQKIFPDVPLQDLIRPREIQLLISHKEGQLVPQKIRSIGDLVLWDGPLGKTIGGTHPDLFEEVTLMAHTSKTHFARSMRAAAFKYQEFTKDLASCQHPDHPETLSTTATSSRDFLKWWRWESIGAACQPRCGGCRCGNCQPGGKEMTLAEEREMEIVRNGLTYSTGDDHSSEPHWHAKYPWVEDPATLPNNRKAVEATFIRTEMKLSKEPEWKTAYAAQVHEMVNRRAAVKLSKEVLQSWTGPVWYISHLIAPNPHSVSTPVRLVWNSSQKYRGLSLNDILIKGPDVLNPIRAVLLRFRAGVYAALGDIRKMYNSVWLEDREVHLHRFLWRDTEDADIEDYAITRVNIGDKPAGCIAQVAMRETANLPSFSHFKEEKRVLEEDAYVDDILTSHNDLDHLRRLTANIERILRAGGFYMKPWVYSSQSGREEAKKELPRSEAKTIILPNQLTEDDNKALGLGYTINDDKLHVMVAVNFSKKRRKMRLGQDLLREEVRERTPDPLTRRELLSQVSGLYDPLGLVTPVKQKGAILVRRAFQEAKVKYRLEDTWDAALSEGLREDAIKLLEEYADLKKLHFTRALTPPDPCAEPSAITFSDGSEHEYGAVIYLRWSCSHSVTVRLVESKAKLTPLNHKGDPVKAEMCGAVFAARLKTYFQRHCIIQVKKWYHFVDSQTILGAIQRESYGFQTFFANRVGEIQSSTDVQDWWWIPGSANIADILTRGASPNALTEDSEWQSGPKFLQLPENEWLKKSAGEVAAQAREKVTKLQKKAFVAVLTRIHTNAAQDSRFTSVRGHPRKIWSDPGTNFVGAKPVLEEMYAYLRQQNKESLEEYSAKNETTWAWKILPADSPHRNGAAEAAVRVTKRALHTLGNAEALTFSEFLTALQLAANLANERPIDARIQSREDRIDYITPNNLLLGRATQSGDFKTIDFTNYPFKRLKEVQTTVNNFWRSWSQLAGPNLFIRSKWHTAERNIAVGDIVWLCDQNALRGQFRLTKVISVNPDSRGIVRDVQVRVSPSSSIAVKSPKSATRSPELSTILHRDIRRLVVLLPVEDQARDQPT
ncbi:G protein-coupled receptor kinase [Sarotherodon galilaeus]